MDDIWKGSIELHYCRYQKKKRINSAALPAWCCDSVILPFKRAEIKVRFYPVYIEKHMLKQDYRYDCDILFVIDYFGYAYTAAQLEDNDCVVIRDVTHSLFSNSYDDADYYFGSLRKWCGVWTGGFAWSNEMWSNEQSIMQPDQQYVHLRERAMLQKSNYICGKSNDRGYLKLFERAERILDGSFFTYGAEERDIECADTMDVELVKNARRSNAKYLLSHLHAQFVFPKLGDNDCPMFVPIIVRNRDQLRKFLISNEIYLPVHWPQTFFHKIEERTKPLYENEISVICDQRYGIEDMKYITQTINAWVEAV